MPDAGLPDEKRRLCIIGAGISGLVAGKVFATENRNVTIYEASGEIGGVWAPSRSYPGVRTQTPRDLYCFSDFPMPADYPEWPSGAQMYDYLCSYAKHFDILKYIRFNTTIVSLARGDAGVGWRVTVEDAGGFREEMFDEVVIGSGQFSQPKMLDLPGSGEFVASGGILMHSSSYQDDRVVTGKDVVILGYSKSATDIAMQAVAAKARSVTMVYREPVWKIPYFFGNLVNFKNILYCRASEVMFMPWAPSRLGRIVRRLSEPMIWANWRALEALLNLQFGLKRKNLLPRTRIEDGIHCATSIETPGFYKTVGSGGIRMVQGTLASASHRHVTTDSGSALAADIVVLAIGWRQELSFLDAVSRAALIEADGLYRLYRMIINPELPGLGLVGFNSSFVTTLSAELGAHWLVRWFNGTLQRRPTSAEMHENIEHLLAWKRSLRPVASTFGGLCVAPYHHEHFDELMRDMGARTRPRNPLIATFLPISPKRYAPLIASARPATRALRETAQ